MSGRAEEPSSALVGWLSALAATAHAAGRRLDLAGVEGPFPHGTRRAGQLAQLLVSLAADRARQQALGKAARKRVEAEFTWASVAKRTQSVYNRLLNLDGPAR